MTDRELLELAAKAAGIELAHMPHDHRKGAGVMTSDMDVWSPLTDDGDALRLAVKLDIGLMPGDKNDPASSDAPMVWTKAGGWMMFYVVIDDPMVAVRRSIVQAAASILSDIR